MGVPIMSQDIAQETDEFRPRTESEDCVSDNV